MNPCARAVWWCLLLVLSAPVAQAQPVRAWLDRNQIALGETATLNIEVEGTSLQPPDYAPLQRDFRLSGHSSSRSYRQDTGRSQARTLYAVALQPLRTGTLRLPALRVAGTSTPTLALSVSAPAAPPAGHSGDAVFIEAEADARAPWVQQAVGYVVRLYSAVPLVSGQLDQAEPDGATLQRVGEDVRYSRDVAGRRYTVIERHYLLIPERSGALEVPGARFRGRGVAGFFDDLFGDGQEALAANGAPRILEVRPIPDAAPQPWLPLRALSLRWTTAPQQARAGAAVTLALELRADGATAAQLPELQLPPVEGAQVFADPAQVDERFVDGRPQVTVSRSFSIVPERAGALRIDGPALAWWDVRSGRTGTTSLPALTLRVAPDNLAGRDLAPAAPPAAAGGDGMETGAWLRVPGVQDPVRPWALATVLFALAWLATLAWGLHRRPAPAEAPPPGGRASARVDAPPLRRALADGDLGDIAAALCASARPVVDDLDQLAPLLADPRQREAIASLQRARWKDGDPAAARSALREAFRNGPRWQRAAASSPGPLPPLYP